MSFASRARRPLLTAATLVLLAGGATACGDDGDSEESSDKTPAADRSHDPLPENPDGAPCTYEPAGEAAREVELPPAKAAFDGDVPVTIETTQGDITATLDGASAPCTVSSFASLASQGFFDDTPCPRIVTEGIFVLQCGDPTGTTSGGPGYAVPDEITGTETYPAGTLAMANSGQPNTGGSQFFIVYADSPLDPTYTVFGSVDADSISVIQDMAANGSDNSNPAGGGAPLKPIDLEYVGIG